MEAEGFKKCLGCPGLRTLASPFLEVTLDNRKNFPCGPDITSPSSSPSAVGRLWNNLAKPGVQADTITPPQSSGLLHAGEAHKSHASIASFLSRPKPFAQATRNKSAPSSGRTPLRVRHFDAGFDVLTFKPGLLLISRPRQRQQHVRNAQGRTSAFVFRACSAH